MYVRISRRIWDKRNEQLSTCVPLLDSVVGDTRVYMYMRRKMYTYISECIKIYILPYIHMFTLQYVYRPTYTYVYTSFRYRYVCLIVDPKGSMVNLCEILPKQM